MKKIALDASIVVAVGVLTSASTAYSPQVDMDGCHDDLDGARSTASDASDAAERAQSAQEEFEDCKRDSDSSDVLDDCRSKRSDYESALNDLESNLDDLDSRLQSVQTSCGYEFTINRLSSVEAARHHLEAAHRRLCSSLTELVALGVAPDKVFQTCKTNSDEQSCKACLGLK